MPWEFGQTARDLDVHVDGPLILIDVPMILTAAAEGIGATRVLHYQCAGLVKEGALRIILEDFELQPLPVHLVHAERGALPSKMRVFLDFAAARLRDRMAAL